MERKETGQGTRVRLYVRLRPLLTLVTGVLVAGYLSCAVALTLWLDRRPHNRVAFADIVLPWNWSGLSALRGQGYCDRGLEELANGQWQQSAFYLNRGLSLAPDNEATRIVVAEAYAQLNYYDGVSRIVRPQFKFGYSRPLLEILFRSAESADDPNTILDVVAELRVSEGLDVVELRWLDEWMIKAWYQLGEPGKSLALLEQKDPKDRRWTLLRVQVLIELDRLDEALVAANTLPDDFDGLLPEGKRAKARVLGAQRKAEELTKLLNELLEGHTAELEPWVFAIEQLVLAEMEPEADQFLDSFLFRFGGKKTAVDGLLDRLIKTKNIPAIKRTMRRVGDWQKVSALRRVSLTMGMIEQADWSGLNSEFVEMVKEDPAFDWFNRIITGVVEALPLDSKAEALSAVLNEKALGLLIYRAMIQGFAQSERWDLVTLVGEAGIRHYQHSSFLKLWLQNAEENREEIVVDTRADELIATSQIQYGEADLEQLRHDLDQLVMMGKWDEVESIVRAVRWDRPAWLSEVNFDLDAADARAGAGQGDVERLIRLAPGLLRRNGEMAEWFTDQAERAIDGGELKLGISLLEAVLEEEESYDRASVILKEWEDPYAEVLTEYQEGG